MSADAGRDLDRLDPVDLESRHHQIDITCLGAVALSRDRIAQKSDPVTGFDFDLCRE